jgi:phosphate transport system substrate-binding protein
MKRKSPIASICSTLLLFTVGSMTPAQADTIKIGGTGAAMAAMSALTQEFRKTNPDADIVVLPAIGSGGAIKGVQSGVVDIGVSARPLKDSERGKGTEETELARTALVFVVPKRNAIAGFSEGELVDIYAGKRTTWPDGSRIRLIMRPFDDSDAVMLKTKFSPAMAEAVKAAETRPGMLFAATDQDAAEMLDRTPGALGVLTLGQVVAEQLALKLLRFDGVEPSVKAAADGTYRHYKVLYLLTPSDAKPTAQRFASFVQSARGKELLAQLGFWTATGK